MTSPAPRSGFLTSGTLDIFFRVCYLWDSIKKEVSASAFVPVPELCKACAFCVLVGALPVTRMSQSQLSQSLAIILLRGFNWNSNQEN